MLQKKEKNKRDNPQTELRLSLLSLLRIQRNGIARLLPIRHRTISLRGFDRQRL